MKRMLLSLTALAILPLSASRGEELLIRAAKVYTMTGPALAPGAVLVSGGKIRAVGANIQAPAGARVLDLGAGVLMPGLLDAYSHAGIAGSASEVTREVTPNYRVLTAIDWRSRAFKEALAEGVTCLAIFPGTDNVVAGLSCVVKTAGTERIVQPDAALVVTMSSDPASGNSARSRPDSLYVRQPTNRMGVVWMLRSTFHQAATSKSLGFSNVREALAGRRKMLAVSRTDSDLLSLLRIASEFKFTPVIVGGQETYKICEELAAAKVPVLLGSLTTSSSGTGPESSEVIWNLPGILRESRVPFAFTGAGLLEQARFAVRYGLPEQDALAAITREPARMLGLEKRIGALQPGLDADLLALSGEPLETTSTIRWVLLDGKLYEQGK